jgi:hypothetical protein
VQPGERVADGRLGESDDLTCTRDAPLLQQRSSYSVICAAPDPPYCAGVGSMSFKTLPIPIWAFCAAASRQDPRSDSAAALILASMAPRAPNGRHHRRAPQA